MTQTQYFSRSQIAAMTIIAAVAACMPPLQPMLLGSLLAEGRITADVTGHAASAEGFGLVVGIATAGALIPPKRLLLVAVLALVTVLAANILTVVLPAVAVTPARACAGVGSGVLLWLYFSMLARAGEPTRLYAGLLVIMASLIFLLSVLLGTYVVGRFGASSGYVLLSILYVALLPIVKFIPSEYADIGGSGASAPPLRGWLGLMGVIIYLTGITGFWVYSVQIGAQTGLSAGAMRMILASATGVQILAGIAAIALSGRLTGPLVMLGTALIQFLAVLMTMTGASIIIWTAAISAFAFCWTFGASFHAAFLIAADPSRRAVLLVGTAQLLGMAMGPLLGSIVVSASDFATVRLFTIACVVAAFVIAAILHVVAARRDVPAEEQLIRL